MQAKLSALPPSLSRKIEEMNVSAMRSLKVLGHAMAVNENYITWIHKSLVLAFFPST